MGRLNISLSNDQIKKIQELAQEQGKTISSIIGESVTLYEKIVQMGRNLKDIEKIVTLLSLIQGLDAVPVPSILLDFSIAKCIENSQEDTIKIWYDTGKKLGEVIKTMAKNVEELKKLVDQYKNIIPVNKLEINGDDRELEIILVGSGYSRESSLATANGLKGFMEVFGFNDFKEEILEGFVKVKGRKIPDANEIKRSFSK